MKKELSQALLTVFFILFITSIFSQERDSLNNTSTNKSETVKPKSEAGNLDMITAPETFEVSSQFNGFISKSHGSAIVVTLINDVAFPLIAKGMNKDFYAKNNLSFISESDVQTVHGYKGKSFKLSFNLEDNDYIRYMVYIGDIKNTLWLNITYPKIVEAVLEPEILKCIDSVNLNPNRGEK